MSAIAAEKRISLKNILYATDFSPAANMALPYVRGLARGFGAKIHILHVRPDTPYVFATPETIPLAAKLDEDEAEDLARELHEVFAKLPHEVLIKKGDLWTALTALVENKTIDLIVIGTTGRTGTGKLLLGSVAAEILRRATCPVLTVGPHTMGSAKQHLEMHEILYATDFSPESLAAAPFAISLAQEHQARLVLLNVLKEPDSAELVHADHFVESTRRLLRNMIPAEADAWCKTETVVKTGDVAEKILEVARERNSDLIVLGVRTPSGLMAVATHMSRAIAQEVVAKSLCPVLTVRGAKEVH